MYYLSQLLFLTYLSGFSMNKEQVQALYLDLVRKEPKITLGEAVVELMKLKGIPALVLNQWFIEQLNMRAEAKRNERKE